MGVGNSTTPSIMFMLEPAVATVSICLPAISALATRGFNRISTSYNRSTWSKKQSSSRSTNRATTKPFSQTLKSLPHLVGRRNTADSKKLQLLPIARRSSIDEKSDVNRSDSGNIEKSKAIDVAIDSPPSTFSPFEIPDERLASKSLELEGRVRQYYERSEFSHGADGTLDLENAGPRLWENPLPVPPKGSLDPAQC